MKSFVGNLHPNLKLIFLLSTLFVHFKIVYRQSFITVLRIYLFIYLFVFLIYELNAVVSIRSNVFYPATWTSKMLYVNFSGLDLLRFACSVSFLFTNVFLTNFLTFYDFPLLVYAVFFCPLTTKIDMKKCQNKWNRETRTQNFLRRPTMVGGKFLGNCQSQQTRNFLKSSLRPV